MNFSHFFIDRPIFATVLSILTVVIGTLSLLALPIEQYPEVAPPNIQVSANYPGADAKTVAETVAAPIEQEVNGVEGMIYMSSKSTADGNMTLTVTFELGTDLDAAQVLVQNRVATAESQLPEAVTRRGVTTEKNSPNMMMVINMFSPEGTYDQTYIANYAVLNIKDRLSRIDGVGDIQLFGASDYSMRIWIDPGLVAAFGMTAAEVVAAIQEQNVQVASGTLNQPPVPTQNAFQISVRTQGRLIEPSEFENIVVKASDDGRIVRLKEVAKVEIGAESYRMRGYLGDKPALALGVFQRPGSNALETADNVLAEMDVLANDFPPDMAYTVVYNPTEFVRQSVDAVVQTLLEAVILVTLVIMVFLQSWRAAIVPVVAIPVSLIGTFAVMSALDITLNNLSLLGLVLAIGIVVDDAIVVIENMERLMKEKGVNARDAARETMTEVSSALIATSLVLVAVFLPVTFLEGISGAFYTQFGITIAVATLFSTMVSLTLSPALAAIVLTRASVGAYEPGGPPTANPLTLFFRGFNKVLNGIAEAYGALTARLVRMILIVLIVYAGLMGIAKWQFDQVPTGFIPAQDQGYLIVALELPPGSSLDRTDAVVQKAVEKIKAIDGVFDAVAFTGFSGASFSSASNSGAIFATLKPFEERTGPGLDSISIYQRMQGVLASIDEAFVIVIPPPPISGIGNGGGYKMMVQDRRNRGLPALEGATWQLAIAANQGPETSANFTLFSNGTPQLYLDIDREKAERLGVEISSVFDALEVYLGSAYVNDFTYLGRSFRVTAQAEAPYRLTPEDVMNIRVRNDLGDMVPIGSVATARDIAGPALVERFNLYPAAALQGNPGPGYSTGEAIAKMEALAQKALPDGFGFEWTELAYQEKQTGDTAIIAFALAVLFVFLLLSAQYESWILPAAIILIVPMCLMSAMTGVMIMHLDNNILTQIGLVVLIGLASKNAILIVEFAKQQEDKGLDRWAAAVSAAKLRLRPILMTSFAFILGVLPLVLATGAGAEMRQSLGIAVFSGMIGVTFFGLIFTPVFYVMMRKFAFVRKTSTDDAPPVTQTEEA